MNIRMILKIFRSLFNRKYRQKHFELNRLKLLPRYIPKQVNIFQGPIKIVDSSSFLFQYDEIFIKNIYKFKSENARPYIIDGGANIGMAIIYWKQLFPQAEIIAFEPDKKVFEALKFNIESLRLSDVSILNKGLWNKETTLSFYAEGSDAGKIIEETEGYSKIDVLELNAFLTREVDFLKLDIEGAELEVLQNCIPNLHYVSKIFIEYHSFIDKSQNLSKILKILEDASFRYIINSTGVYNSHPYLKIDTYLNMDLQLNISGFKHNN